MHFGGAMFFTDYSMSAPELARALEERGFESVWAPEHSHIPLSRKTPFPGGGDLPKQYCDAMDPFVVLAAAAQATKTIFHFVLVPPTPDSEQEPSLAHLVDRGDQLGGLDRVALLNERHAGTEFDGFRGLGGCGQNSNCAA